MEKRDVIERIIEMIPDTLALHDQNTKFAMFANDAIRDYFQNFEGDVLDVGPYKGMRWPHISIGNLNSYCFFEFYEVILHRFYEVNRDRYKVTMDVGGNIGIDSIIMSHLGYEVYVLEPDPGLFATLESNAALNDCQNFSAINKALSNERSTLPFIRVKGNESASHIAGSRGYYGDYEQIDVEACTFEDLGVIPDLMKINIEGHEKTLVPAIPAEVWDRTDAFIEVHSDEDRQVLWDHYSSIGVNIFTQKIGWQQARKVEDLPKTSRDGYAFASRKSEMPW